MPCTVSALVGLLARFLHLVVYLGFTQLHNSGHSSPQSLKGTLLWEGEGGLGIALLAWLAAISPTTNADGLDLLRHGGNWHVLLSSPMLGVLRDCNDLQSFSLRLNVSLSSAPSLPWLKAENTEG